MKAKMKIKKRKKGGKKRERKKEKKKKKEMNDKRGKASYESNAGVRSYVSLLLLTFDTVASKGVSVHRIFEKSNRKRDL